MTNENVMERNPLPRICALHDLSCYGRCALTVILPTLSAMGYQVIPLPTALLSSHTGGFDGLHFRDLGRDMGKISDHFLQIGTTFRSIYTGFLGSAEQIGFVGNFLDRFADLPDETGKKPLVLIDPVMGDDGVLYSTYDEPLVEGMRILSRRAEVLTPNLTEACFLLNREYWNPADMTVAQATAYAWDLLDGLESWKIPRIVITGIAFSNGEVANFGRDADGSRFTVSAKTEVGAYPGTGDLFASVLLGSLLREDRFSDACRRAADFTGRVIRISSRVNSPVRNGLTFEDSLWRLAPRKGNADE